MLQCKNLSKSFKIYKKEPGLQETLKSFIKRDYYINEAVKDFNLNITSPNLIGLLGPNGSGKTTLMKMFTGIISPSSGSLKILNEIPNKRKNCFKKNISLVMGQKSQLIWDIPGMDSLLLFQKFYEIEEHLFKKRVSDLSERLDTTAILNIPIRKLSLGERMKMELMACLLHEPKIIFLDEPTIGLDINAQKNVRQFLKDYFEEKQPLILLTSHYMADVEALCKDIILITKGEKKFEGSMDSFKENFKKEKTIIFNFQDPITNPQDDHLKNFHHKWNREQNQLSLRVPEKSMKEVTVQILNQYPVSDFHTEKVSIEEIMDQFLAKS